MSKAINNQVAGLFSNFSIPGESAKLHPVMSLEDKNESMPEQNDVRRKKVKICSVMSEDILAKAKALSKKEGYQLCDILDAAVHNLVKEYEAENGILETVQSSQKKKSLYH